MINLFTFTVEINSVAYKPEIINQTFKVDESLDSALLVLPFLTTKEAFPRFSNVKVAISDGTTTRTTYWILYSDKVEVSTKKTLRYDHTIGLIESTKVLEKYACGSLSFTQPISGSRYTMYDVVERIRILSPFVPYQVNYETRVFYIDDELQTYLETINAPQFYLDKKNLREALVEVFKYINAIPRLQYEYEVGVQAWIYVLYADFINNRLLNITPSSQAITALNITDYGDEVSGENYATSVESYLENVIPNEEQVAVINQGATTNYVTFRSDEYIVGDSNAKLILPFKVANIISMYIYGYASGGSSILEYSLSNFLYEKKVYDTLDLNGGLGKKDHSIYWNYGSDRIDGFFDTFGVLNLQTAIDNIRAYLGLETTWQYLVFKVQYIPYIETMRTEQYREDYNYLKETEIQINQSERINSLYDVTKNIFGQIQRIGVDTLSFAKLHKTLHAYDGSNLGGIYSVGDYTSDGYFISAVEVVYYNFFVVARYELSKNWNRIAQFIQIPKEFRPYEITLTKSDFTLKRDLLMPFAFVEVSSTQRMDASGLTKYGSLITQFMKTITTNATNNLTVNGAMLSIAQNNIGVYSEVASVAENNTLKWLFSFKDTKLAGDKTYFKDVPLSTVDAIVKQQVPYTETDGTFEFASIGLYNKYWTIATTTSDVIDLMRTLNKIARDFPYIDGGEVITQGLTPVTISGNVEIYLNSTLFPATGTTGIYYIALDNNMAYIWNGSSYVSQFEIGAYRNDPLFSLPTYQVLKDSSEILGFQMFMPILPYKTEFNRFVIGDSLSKENGLIKLRRSGKIFYLRSTNAFFSKANTQKFTDSSDQYLLPNTLITDNYIDVSTIPYIHNNFAIVDSGGNIYIAVNRMGLDGVLTVVDKIYFNFMDRRTQADLDISIPAIFVGAASLNLGISVYASGFMPVWYDDTAELDLSIAVTASGVLQFNYADDAALELELGVVAYGIMVIYQVEQGTASVALSIGLTATGEEHEFANRWVLTEDDTYDYTSSSTGLSAPTEPAANYNVGEIMRKWNGIDAYRYWIIVFD